MTRDSRRWTSGWVGAAAGGDTTIVVDPAPAGADEIDEATLLFVYGTMKPGHLRYPLIDEFVASTEPDRVEGSLFDSGAGYPAAVFEDSDSMIEGFVIRLIPVSAAEANEVIADAENNLFRAVVVETEGGPSAVAYEYIEDTSELEEIPDGVWENEQEA